MRFANPWMLLALVLPVLAAWWVYRSRLNAKPLWPAMRRVSIGASVGIIKPGKPAAAYLILAAVALGVIALARPQWGEESGQSFSESVEVMIALDLSRSMNQTSRLSAAKTTIRQLLDDLRGENVGLVLFAGTAFVQVPMSPDYQILREFLPSLDPNYMPVGGTDYDGMLAAALEGFSPNEDRERYLIVLSDGEPTKPALEPTIADLLRRRVHVIGIGFGTEQGAATLQGLATRTEGRYAPATTTGIHTLIKDTVESGRATVGVERFQWLLMPAVLLSLLSLVREFRRVHALIVLVCVLVPLRVQAQADPAQQVRAAASHMGKFGYDPSDLKLMVEAAMQFALNERARGRLPLAGVMRDAVDAARMGKKLAPNLAPWDRYESQIRDLMVPLPVEAKEPENEYTDDEDHGDEQFYKPVPLRKAKDKAGKDLFGQNTRSRSEFALGDLSGDETFAPQEPHGRRRGPAQPPPKPALTPTPADDATMAEARKNFATVVKGDSPGRVHQLLNGEGRRAVERDW